MTVDRSENRLPLAVFLAITFGGSAALSIAFATTGGASGPLSSAAVIAMFLPALAVLCVRLAFRAPAADLGWRRFPARWLPLALFVFPVAIHALTLPTLYLLEGRLPWVAWLDPANDGLYHAPRDRGWGVLSSSALAGRIALNAIAGLVMVSVLSFFEEIGWRAWLLPRLVTRHGARLGALASSALWAAWHAPYALSGIDRIEDVAPATLAALLSMGLLGAGLLLALMWLRTRSILMVSLAHGSLNNWGQYALKFMDGESDHETLLLVAASSAMLLVGALALMRLAPQRSGGPAHP